MEPTHRSPRRALAWRLLSLVCASALALAPACGGRARPQDPGQPPPPVAVAPMDLGGQRVLILPVQGVGGMSFTRDDVTAEVVAALRARDTRTQWIDPARLRRTLSQSPNFAPDPGALPNDSYLHRGERSISGQLADVVRRYSALTEARIVVIPRAARFMPAADSGGGGHVRMSVAVADARTGLLVWFGEVDGPPVANPTDRRAIVGAAEALARSMVVADAQ